MGGLYIVGTEHTDMVYGPRKLAEIYNQIHPDILLEEMNEPDLRRFHRLCSELEKELMEISDDKKGVDRFIKLFTNSIGFEGSVNRDYSELAGIPNYMIDMPGGQKRLIGISKLAIRHRLKKSKQRGELEINNWIEGLLCNGHKSPEAIRKRWEDISAYEGTLIGELPFLVGRIIGRIGKPDKYMELRIRELYDPDKVIAFPVGMLHTLESISGSTVYSRIKDLNPIRIPLV